MFRIFWRLVFLALLLSLLARCSPTHPPTPRGTPKDTATNTPKQLGDPATLLQDAQNKGHVLNLLEYTRALHAKYGRQPQDQQQTQTKLSGASVSAAGVTPNPGPPDNDLNSSLSFSTEQAKLYEVGNNMWVQGTRTSWHIYQSHKLRSSSQTLAQHHDQNFLGRRHRKSAPRHALCAMQHLLTLTSHSATAN